HGWVELRYFLELVAGEGDAVARSVKHSLFQLRSSNYDALFGPVEPTISVSLMRSYSLQIFASQWRTQPRRTNEKFAALSGVPRLATNSRKETEATSTCS